MKALDDLDRETMKGLMVEIKRDILILVRGADKAQQARTHRKILATKIRPAQLI